MWTQNDQRNNSRGKSRRELSLLIPSKNYQSIEVSEKTTTHNWHFVLLPVNIMKPQGTHLLFTFVVSWNWLSTSQVLTKQPSKLKSWIWNYIHALKYITTSKKLSLRDKSWNSTEVPVHDIRKQCKSKQAASFPCEQRQETWGGGFWKA